MIRLCHCQSFGSNFSCNQLGLPNHDNQKSQLLINSSKSGLRLITLVKLSAWKDNLCIS